MCKEKERGKKRKTREKDRIFETFLIKR